MDKKLKSIESIVKTDSHYAIQYIKGEKARINILNSHVFRYHMSPTGEFFEYPKPHNSTDVAKINIKRVKDYDKKAFDKSGFKTDKDFYLIYTDKIEIFLDKIKGTMKVHDNRNNKDVLKEYETLSYANHEAIQYLHQHSDEFFFGGGMQNGRFTHKGNAIEIVNNNNWASGGVTSPCPFFWSSYGYGVLRNTWQDGVYDFGTKFTDHIKIAHTEEYFDAFYFINITPKNILQDYYELTGWPIFMPEYAFYEAHLNTFNRDYWVRVEPCTPGAILYEDGKYYKRYQPDSNKEGILESLNGEKNNYQFSARAMIDRYKKYDMPLGWFIPNDGYGSGYGQTDSLDGDIKNLIQFADYSRKNGVEVALWTESDLHPCDPENPKKGERDLSKEIGIAGVVALKCDVAWIGQGYSFALNAVENATNVFIKETKHRPMIIMVDGWAGTQRYAGIWSGDQAGGEWEFIRFHIPTYIGTGLSGQPVIGSDMDGIYGGCDREVNVRDYQWKTFTPFQLNMDGWGSTPKTPFSFDEECTAINRAYLKLKSMLMPYNYTIGYESTQGLPMVRAMFLEFPKEELAYTIDSQYQFMWGPSILVAPVYKKGNMERSGIYLPNPKQIWIDFFTGKKYQGGRIIDNLSAPLWKIPVFVKYGAIIPMINSNNNPYEINRSSRIFQLYPNGETNFDVYEDDGITSEYLDGHFATTKITCVEFSGKTASDLRINIEKTKGDYNNMVKERTTLIRIIASEYISKIKSTINGKSLELTNVFTDIDFENNENVYFFKNDFMINPYLADLSGDKIKQKCLLIKIKKIDVTENDIHIIIKGYINTNKVFNGYASINLNINTPANIKVMEEKTTPTSITLKWDPVFNASYYEIERDGAIFSNIKGTIKTFENFQCQSQHTFRIRAVNEGVSEWSDFILAVTAEDPEKYTVKHVKVSCNIPCEPSQEVCKLTNGNPNTIWHTCWGPQGKANPQKGYHIQLNFDLGDIYHIDKVEYSPRTDAGNGTFLQVQYRFSINDTDWSPMSDIINWSPDSATKIIRLNGTSLRFMEINALKTIGDFGSGRQMSFFKKPE